MDYVPSDDDVAAAMAAVEREQQMLPPEIVCANNNGLPIFGGREGDYARAKVEYNAKRAREEGKLVDEKERAEIRTEAGRAREQNAAAKVYLETKKQDQDEN